MEKLISGIVKFRRNNIRQYRKKFAKLADAIQSPDVLFIACCDSRVVPNVFVSTDPGDLFVHRNIGNIVPPCSSIDNTCTGATIAFAVSMLRVKHIVVCGHSECGAMQAVLTRNCLMSYDSNCQINLRRWLQNVEISKQRFESCIDAVICEQYKSDTISLHNVLSQVNVLQQLDNLLTYDLVSEKVKNNELRLHGWWFDLATADVCYYNGSKFVTIDVNTIN